MKKVLLVLFVVIILAAAAWPQDVFEALRKGDIQAVKALVENSPEVLESRDRDGLTLLHYAAFGGDAGLINYLVDKGAKLEPANSQETPLHLAAQNDRSEAVAALIKKGAPLETRDDYSRTALILCARERGQSASARILLNAGADINAADKYGDTALSLAAWRGKLEVVDLLLDKGAGVPASGDRWKRLLSESASHGLTKLFRRLTEGDRDLKAGAGSTPALLHSAAQGGSAEIVDVLIKKGFDPAEPDMYGWTPLHYAALDGRTETARKLVKKGAPLNARTMAGQSPYNVARERGMEDVVKLLAENGAETDAAQFPVLQGDYLGQKPPADEPEVFAPGIVSSIWGLHTTAVFSPDGNEVYWGPMMTFPGEVYSRGWLFMMKRVDGRWSSPARAPFSGPDFRDDVPFFSADGKRIYFISRRPLSGGTEARERIWFADRTTGGWSEPRPIDATVNDQQMHWQFSLDKQGNLYFASSGSGGLGMDDIYCARFVDGKYEKPVNLGETINTADAESTPFIAPDGSYLLFSRDFGIWASFRGMDGSWSKPVNLGPEVRGLCPQVTADGKYLFFSSLEDDQRGAFWIKADIIDKARLKSRQKLPTGDELEQIERSIRDSIGWAKTKDFRLLYGIIANDPDFLEVHPDGNVVKGFEDFKKAETFWGSPDFKAVRYEIRDLKIKLSKSGDVAWFYCILDDINEWKGQSANWENTRWTGVLEKREDRWVIVQQHFSFAAKD